MSDSPPERLRKVTQRLALIRKALEDPMGPEAEALGGAFAKLRLHLLSARQSQSDPKASPSREPATRAGSRARPKR